LAGCVLQSLRLFGACHKKQCRVDWLSNRILKSSDDTAATPETASIGSGKLCPSRAPIGLPKDREEKPIVRFWPTAKRAAPRTIEWGRGEVEKFKASVPADRGGAAVLLYFIS
jgi:hypothetical protein